MLQKGKSLEEEGKFSNCFESNESVQILKKLWKQEGNTGRERKIAQ
jgi:hypothetical protein